MARENKTVYVILGFLNHESLTGYDIKKRIDGALSYFWNTGFGQIYPTLNQLEQKGWISKQDASNGQKLERHLYAITDSGRHVLAKWLSKPVENEQVKFEILLKLFFGSAQPHTKNIETIQAFKTTHLEQIPTLKEFEKQLRQVLPASSDHLYYLLTVLFGQKIYEAYAAWADEAIALLENADQTLLGGNDEH